MNCAECTHSFKPRRHDQIFCSKQCKDDQRNRASVRALRLYRELYHWAGAGRAGGGKMLSAVTREARGWVAEDRANGRSPPPEPEWRRIERLNEGHASRLVEAVRMLTEREKAR